MILIANHLINWFKFSTSFHSKEWKTQQQRLAEQSVRDERVNVVVWHGDRIIECERLLKLVNHHNLPLMNKYTAIMKRLIASSKCCTLCHLFLPACISVVSVELGMVLFNSYVNGHPLIKFSPPKKEAFGPRTFTNNYGHVKQLVCVLHSPQSTKMQSCLVQWFMEIHDGTTYSGFWASIAHRNFRYSWQSLCVCVCVAFELHMMLRPMR